jgi:hypothetical protein
MLGLCGRLAPTRLLPATIDPRAGLHQLVMMLQRRGCGENRTAAAAEAAATAPSEAKRSERD